MAAGLTSVPKKRSLNPSSRGPSGGSSRRGGGASYPSEPEFGWQNKKRGDGGASRDRGEARSSAAAPGTNGGSAEWGWEGGEGGGDDEGFAGGWRGWEEVDSGLGGATSEKWGQEGRGSADSGGDDEEAGGML